ncbi:putative ribonuclease H protein At1g65750 family [Senna tora]|uniref:Putative ribonuclease H protein At1g65750 family n=1 Tax=Senna tora TaxID=362788 RepID=A0A834WTU4_9FABA|nr:putative ribonuclease H protein At1g65750 family [Senna tora]
MYSSVINIINNGARIKFCRDYWVHGFPTLESVALAPIPQDMINMATNQFISISGEWNWSSFPHLLPQDVLNTIACIEPPRVDQGPDQYAWDLEPSGNFTVKSAYLKLISLDSTNMLHIWKKIWKCQTTQRIRFFLWSMAHDSIMTQSQRMRRHFITSDVCSRTNNATPKWKAPNEGWIKFNVDGSHCPHTDSSSCGGIARDNNGTWILGFAHRIGRSNSFQAEAWAVWSALRIAKDRNWPKVIIETDSFVVMQMIQQGCPNPHPLDFLFRKIRSLMNTWNSIVINHSGKGNGKQVIVRLAPPLKGKLKINCDGAYADLGKVAGVGVLVRNWKGHVVDGFSRRVKDCSPLMTEALAIEAAVECVENLAIISNIDLAKRRLPDVSFNFVGRCCNKATNWLAKAALGRICPVDWVCAPPSSLACILASDKLGDRAGIG